MDWLTVGLFAALGVTGFCASVAGKPTETAPPVNGGRAPAHPTAAPCPPKPATRPTPPEHVSAAPTQPLYTPESPASAPTKRSSRTARPPELAQRSQQLLEECMQRVREGALDEAEPLLQQMLELNRQDPEAWFWMGWVYARRGHIAGAQYCFEFAQRYRHPEAARAIQWCKEQE